MMHLRCHKTQSSTLLRSTPDLTQDPKADHSSRSTWRTSSANVLHRTSSARSPTTDSSAISNRYRPSSKPSSSDYNLANRRTGSVSPHHSRSQSFRSSKRHTPQHGEGGRPIGNSPRGRTATMPNDQASYLLARRRMRSRQDNLTPSPQVADDDDDDNDDDDDECYLLRSFSVNSKGVIVSRSDFLRQRSRSSNSVASSGSAVTTNASNLSNATSFSSGSTRGPSSKVKILGGLGVGKTALVVQFMTSEYMEAYDTQDDDFEKSVSVLLDGIEYELIFLDDQVLAENKILHAVSNEMDAYIVVYSVTERSSFEKAVDILFSLRERNLTSTKAVILVGNKSDLARSREIAIEEGKSIASSYECKFIETSAAINHNVDELLVGVVSQIRLKLRQKEKPHKKVASASSSPLRKAGGSVKGALRSSFRTKTLLNKLIGKGSRSKSCDNLHVL